VHYRAGRLLMQRAGTATLAELAHEIANHLNRVAARLVEPERVRLVAVNLLAAQRALRAGSPAIAVEYLAAARKLTRDSDWESHREQTFELVLESARCAVQSRDVDQATSLLDSLEPRARSVTECTAVAVTRVRAQAGARRYRETVELVLRSLRPLGLDWPAHPSRAHAYVCLIRTQWALRRARADRPPRPQAPIDAAARGRIEILSAGAAAISASSRRLALVSMSWRARAALRGGYVLAPGAQLLAYAAYAFHFRHDFAALRRLADIGAAWSKALDDATAQVRAKYVLGARIHPWLMPRMRAAAGLREVIDSGRELGDSLVITYTRLDHACMRALSGAPIGQAERELRELAPPVGDALGDLVGLLGEGAEDRERVARTIERIFSLPPELVRQWCTIALLVLYVLDEPTAMQSLLERLTPLGHELVSGSFHAADLYLYRGLAAGTLANVAGETAGRRRSRILRRASRKLRHFATEGPDFAHMAALLEAEHLALRGGGTAALAAYQQAAQRAERQGYIHHAAIAHERRAALLHTGRREIQARDALREAARRYHAWGAQAKVAQLMRRIARP
jgi:hypothetical protein